jgi:hypothetical protein
VFELWDKRHVVAIACKGRMQRIGSPWWWGRSGTTARVSLTVKVRYDAKNLQDLALMSGGGASGSAYTTDCDWTARLIGGFGLAQISYRSFP